MFTNFLSFIKLPKEQRSLVFLLLISLAPISLFFLGACINIIGLSFLNNYLKYILLLLFTILSWHSIGRYIKANDLLFYFLFVSFIFCSPLIYPRSYNFIEEYGVKFAFSVVPYYLLGLSLNYSKLSESLKWIARVGVLLQVLFQLFCLAGFVNTYNNNEDMARESMVFSYGFLYSALYILKLAMEETNLLDIILSIMALFLLLIMGTRGPVVVYLVFFLGMVLIFNQYKRFNILKKVLVFISLFGVYYFLTPILTGVAMFVASLGLSTRVFDSFLDSRMFDFSESSGRDEIFFQMKHAIESDFSGFGYGFGGDRLFTDVYAHNLQTEILVSFGLIGGGILLFLLAILTIRAFLLVRNRSDASFLFLLFCYGVVGLQFSSTWIESTGFFLYIGFCISILRFRCCKNTCI